MVMDRAPKELNGTHNLETVDRSCLCIKICINIKYIRAVPKTNVNSIRSLFQVPIACTENNDTFQIEWICGGAVRPFHFKMTKANKILINAEVRDRLLSGRLNDHVMLQVTLLSYLGTGEKLRKKQTIFEI